MLILLGFERTGDNRKAEEAALSLWKGEDWVLAPHVAYALGRLSLKEGRVEEAKKWYGAMAESAKDTAFRKQALGALLRLPDPDPKYALAMLEIAPFHRGALSMVRKDLGPEDPRTAFPLGYASFFSGDLEGAIAQLGRVPREDPCFERAAFFKARALSNLGRPDEALPIWKELSLGRSRYSQSSIELISRMAREKGGLALETLVEISDSAQGDPAASALAELAGLFAGAGDEKEASRYEEVLLERYPTSRFAAAPFGRRMVRLEEGDQGRRRPGLGLDAENDPRQESRLLLGGQGEREA